MPPIQPPKTCPGPTDTSAPNAQSTTTGKTDLPACTSRDVDSLEVQEVHRRAYNGIVNAYNKCNSQAQNPPPAVREALCNGAAVNAIVGATTERKLFENLAAQLQTKAGTAAPKVESYPDEITNGTLENTPAGYAAFIRYCLNKMPLDPATKDAPPTYASDGDGNAISMTARDASGKEHVTLEKKTLIDFHVARMASLALFKVAMSLVVATVFGEVGRMGKSDLNTADETNAIENLTNCAKLMARLEQLVTTNLGYDSDKDGYSEMELFYVYVRELSSQNLSRSAFIEKLQTEIKARRDNLQTALNTEAQIDKIVFWAKLWWWVWIFVFIAGVAFTFWAVMTGNGVLIYIALAALLLLKIVAWILSWFGLSLTVMDITDLNDNLSLALGIPRVTF